MKYTEYFFYGVNDILKTVSNVYIQDIQNNQVNEDKLHIVNVN
jgi:hypothetical protein